MNGNYPAGVTDNDPYFDMPNAHEDKEALYGLMLDTYDGQIVNMAVYDNAQPLALTLEEIKDAQREYSNRNPKGRYSIVSVEEQHRRLALLQWRYKGSNDGE